MSATVAHRAVLVEDEPHALAYLKGLLGAHRDSIEIVGEAMDGPQAIGIIRATRPSLVFLDVALPGMDGFEVAASIPPGAMLIWTTASADHAMQAHDHLTMGYLLKPFDAATLARTIGKLAHVPPPQAQLFADLRRFLEMSARPRRTLTCKVGKALIALEDEEIFYFESELKYTTIVTRTARYLSDTPVYELEANLDPLVFMRIHRKRIINLRHVKQLEPLDDGKYEFTLRGIPAKVKSSRTYQEKINEVFSPNKGGSAGKLKTASMPDESRYLRSP